MGALLLLGVIACSNNDDELEREARTVCDGIQPGVTTIRQVEQLATFGTTFVGCEADRTPIEGQSCGEPASVCFFRWQWLSRGDCGPGGGCAYVCEARVQDTASGGLPSRDAVVCARQFLRQQPVVF